jgi:hypothetical protein
MSASEFSGALFVIIKKPLKLDLSGVAVKELR